MDRDFITIVSGLPRSGTSLMMQMLAAGGIAPLSDDLRAPDESNPRGYFEFEPVKQLRADHSWLNRARGKVVKIIHLLLRELPCDGSFTYRVVLMKRPIEEVLASQSAMLQRQGKTSADSQVLAKVYLAQLAQIEEWLAAQPSFKVLKMEYHHLLANARDQVQSLNEFLGGGLNLDQMEQAIDPALYRQRMI